MLNKTFKMSYHLIETFFLMFFCDVFCLALNKMLYKYFVDPTTLYNIIMWLFYNVIQMFCVCWATVTAV